MDHICLPEGYRAYLNGYEKQEAIALVKQVFLSSLSEKLRLTRVSAPLFVRRDSGLNDNLSGKERPVSFESPAIDGVIEVVHSLAKWKRVALKRYGFSMGEGLITDMNAIRRDEELDNLHSLYVDQWDWEKIIGKDERTVALLQGTVQKIVDAVVDTEDALRARFPVLDVALSRKVAFITAEELEKKYPELSPDERENEYTKKYRTVCIIGIGDTLSSGKPHGMRAPDYDDWRLNCDILFWSDTLSRAVEISSMGIRVDEDALRRQLTAAGCEERASLPYHRALLSGELPQTIGGGIGQSRLCLLLLGCAHIGEVQAGLWDDETVRACREHHIDLL